MHVLHAPDHLLAPVFVLVLGLLRADQYAMHACINRANRAGALCISPGYSHRYLD